MLLIALIERLPVVFVVSESHEVRQQLLLVVPRVRKTMHVFNRLVYVFLFALRHLLPNFLVVYVSFWVFVKELLHRKSLFGHDALQVVFCQLQRNFNRFPEVGD